jgi:hypothetical protein
MLVRALLLGLLCLVPACQRPRGAEPAPTVRITESTGVVDTVANHVLSILFVQARLLIGLWIIVIPAGLHIAWLNQRGDRLRW